MNEKTPGINHPKWINPAYEESQLRQRFDKEYADRKTMDFEFGEFEYIDITPEKPTGKDIFIATGVPWSWDQMEDFVFSLFRSGHRVMAIGHPELNLKEAKKYQPEIQRPEAIETFWTNKQLNDVIVVAHSFGFVDILRRGKKNIGGIVALNPAGLSENNPLQHSLRALKNIRTAVFQRSATPEKELAINDKMLRNFLAQSPVKSVKEVFNVGTAEMSRELKEFSSIPITIMRNPDDTIVPIDKVRDGNFQELGAGNHLGPFIYKEQMQAVANAIKEIEASASSPSA